MDVRPLLVLGLIGVFLTGCGYQMADGRLLRGISVNIDTPEVDVEVLRALQAMLCAIRQLLLPLAKLLHGGRLTQLSRVRQLDVE